MFLRGRLADGAQLRALPSGDELCVFRLTVDRSPTERTTRVKVDSIDCASDRNRVRRSVLAAEVGQVLEVQGSLRRRFWRGAGGLGSRYEVQASQVRIIRRRNDA